MASHYVSNKGPSPKYHPAHESRGNSKPGKSRDSQKHSSAKGMPSPNANAASVAPKVARAVEAPLLTFEDWQRARGDMPKPVTVKALERAYLEFITESSQVGAVTKPILRNFFDPEEKKGESPRSVSPRLSSSFDSMRDSLGENDDSGDGLVGARWDKSYREKFLKSEHTTGSVSLKEKKLTKGGVSPASSAYALQQKVEVLHHENGIFGSYVLEDARALDLLAKNVGYTDQFYDCFNYETVPKLLENEKLAEVLVKNSALLRGKHVLHYLNKPNDLISQIFDASTDWNKGDRKFKNMVFFNPYMSDHKKLDGLIKEFFAYAGKALDPEGSVIMMWQEGRKDRLDVNVIELAINANFELKKSFSGYKFEELTDFEHKKNSKSLEIDPHETDVGRKKNNKIYHFKRLKANITKNNLVHSLYITLSKY